MPEGAPDGDVNGNVNGGIYGRVHEAEDAAAMAEAAGGEQERLSPHWEAPGRGRRAERVARVGVAAVALVCVLAACVASLRGLRGAKARLRAADLPGEIDGVPITRRMQDLVPALGECYVGNPRLRDAVLLWRQRAADKALELLRAEPGLEARHLAVNIAQMHDRTAVVSAEADRILAERPADPHALFVKGLYAAADGQMAAHATYLEALRGSSVSAAGALDAAVSDVVLAWDGRSYPPYAPDSLPAGWAPRGLAIVVFGCPVLDDGAPSPALAERLRAALALARRFPRASIIASGGAVSSRFPESLFVRDWLVNNSVSAGRIFVDSAARDTLGNSMFVSAWLQARPEIGSVIVDTSSWHSPRARLNLQGALETRGVQVSVVSVGSGQAGFPAPDLLRERLELERKASHRDLARARGWFTLCDF